MNAESQRRIHDAFLRIQDLAPGEATALVGGLTAEEQTELAGLLADDGGFLNEPLPAQLARYHSTGSSSVIGPYQLIEPIGHGGMGTVYRARRVDGLLRQEFAVKLIRALPGDEMRVTGFQREMQILSLLQHPYIVRYYDGGATADGWLYLAMELLEGQSFTRDAFPGGDRGPLLRAFTMVCEGMAHAHREGVLHRDLKPQNILLLADGTPRILDFGVSKLADGSRTARQAAMTYTYASPEQLSGTAAVTASSDVFSLGILLYESLGGAHPYNRETAALPGVPGTLMAITRRCLEKQPERRYPSAVELLADMRRYQAGERTVAGLRRNWGWVRAPKRMVVAVTMLAAAGIYWHRQRESAELLDSLSPKMEDAATLPGEPQARINYCRERIDLVDRYIKVQGATAELLGAKLHYLVNLGETEGHPSVANVGDARRSAETLTKACEFGRSLPGAVGEQAAVWALRARACGAAGGVLLELGKTEEAEAYFRELVAFTSKGNAWHPPLVRALAEAEAHATLSRITERRGDWPETLRLLRRAVGLLEPFGEAGSSGLTLAGHLGALGWAEREAGDLGAALASYRRAEGLLDAAVRLRRRDVNIAVVLARNLGEQGRILLGMGQRHKALEPLQRSLALHDRALTLEPDSVSTRRWRAMTLARLASAGAGTKPAGAWAAAAREEIARVVARDTENQLIRREQAEIFRLCPAGK